MSFLLDGFKFYAHTPKIKQKNKIHINLMIKFLFLDSVGFTKQMLQFLLIYHSANAIIDRLHVYYT